MIKLYNSLSNKIENFNPLKENEITIYVCGPTVYDRIHLGNARSVIIFDFIYRFLKEKFPEKKIKYIRNITDVDDKIIKKAQEMNISENQLTQEMINFFWSDLKYLNCIDPSFQPKVTEEILTCIEFIEKIIQNGFAYEKDGNILFSVKKFKDYGKLSNRQIENNINLTRDIKKIEKENENDFILWKKTSQGANWNSPWGKGRPGWHLECSAMSYKYLGENFDIHGGGLDLKFPHHENEIAQSKCGNLHSDFAKYWLHNGILTINGEKMSKSLGNFTTIQNLRDKNINPFVIRFAILSAHYRNSLDFNYKLLEDRKITLNNICYYIFLNFKIEELKKQISSETKEKILNIISEDFDSIRLINHIINICNKIYKKAKPNEDSTEEAGEILYALEVLGIDVEKYIEFEENLKQQKQHKLLTHSKYHEVVSLVNLRIEAKKQKNFQKADEIRIQIENLGFKITDLPNNQFDLEAI